MNNFKFLVHSHRPCVLCGMYRGWVKQIYAFSTLKPDLDNNSIDIKPVVKYDNACEDKSKILKENKNKSGVYRWINKLNGKTYVGSSTNLRVRLYKYYSIGSLGNNLRVIDRALFKYGFSSFSFEILEYCDKNILLEREQYYLGALAAGAWLQYSRIGR